MTRGIKTRLPLLSATMQPLSPATRLGQSVVTVVPIISNVTRVYRQAG
jgi:hypothetical protein